MKRSGWSSVAPSVVIEIDDVFDAMIAPGRATS
jgi:hypothetical protein